LKTQNASTVQPPVFKPEENKEVIMDLEFDYFASGLQMALTVVSLSLVLLIDFSRPSTVFFAAGIPFILGYTAFISDNRFRKESLASMIGLMFLPLGGLVAAVSVFLLVLNVLVSFFASGNTFRDYYSSTALPLLVSGLLIGVSVGGMAFYSQDFASEVEDSFVDQGAERTMNMIEITGLGSDAEKNLRDTTYSNVLVTENFVVNQYIQEAEDPETRVLQEAFSDAREEVPDTVVNQSGVADGEQQRKRIEQAIRKTVQERIPIIMFVFAVTALYALQPVIGVLTAFSSLCFRVLDNIVSES